jgi:Flp pilus assembly protein TadG
LARKNTLVTQLVANQSLSASFITAPTVVRYLDNCSYQINVTTTNSTGTFVVQASNDYYVNEGNDNVVVNSGNWVTLTLAGGTPFVAAANDVITVNLNQLPFYAIRLSYTATIAGTGTCSIYIVNKQIGG